MADPLSTISDEYAPAKSNYFDKGQAATLIARYGNANREAASARSLGAAAARNQAFEQNEIQSRAMEARMARDELLQTREDREYNEKMEADELRSQFLSDFDKNMRSDDPAYNEKLVGFLAEAPESLKKDPTFMGIVGIRNKQADEYLQQRNKESEIMLRQQNTLEAIRERAKNDDTLKFLREEDLTSAPRDEKGEIDYMKLGMLAKQREMEAKLAVDEKKVGFRKEAAIDILNMKNADASARELYADVKNVVINDREAFPSRLDALRQTEMRERKSDRPLSDADLKKRKAAEYAAAEQWDKKMFENEVLTARKYDNVEDYLEFNAPDGKPAQLSPSAIESRRKLWEAAQTGDEVVTEAVVEAPVAETPTAEQPAAKPLTEDDRKNVRPVVRDGYEYIVVGGKTLRRKIPASE